jgi:hypothetical protein
MSGKQIINYYDKIKNKKPLKRDNDIGVDDNSRWAIIGRSGSYKTSTMMNILREIGFDTLNLCVKMPDEPLYQDYLIPLVRKLEKKIKEPLLDITTSPDEIKDMSEFDRDLKNIIIFDDMIVTPKQENIKNIYMAGRKYGISSFFLSQSFFDMNKFLRKNLDYIVLKSLSSVKDMKRVLAEFNSNDIDADVLVSIHKRAIAEDPKSFLLIDLKSQDPNKKYRINFDRFIRISD